MPETTSDIPFTRFLKYWRGVHNISQEELAYSIESSSRHLSRIENGSSRPSESLVLEIAKVLQLGQRDTNHLLISAGYMAKLGTGDFNAPEYKWLRNAMTRKLKALDPFPATIMDASSNILMVNKGWVGLFSTSIASDVLNKVTNHYDFLFSREGAGTAISDWENTLSVILMSLKQQALFTNNQLDLTNLDRLSQHQNVPTDWEQRAAKLEPMASFRVQMDIDGVLTRFFSVSSNVGAMGPSAYISEPNITVNVLFPEDESMQLDQLIAGELTHPLLFY
jgi:transcriptional regulator with XRE-family HTH domain